MKSSHLHKQKIERWAERELVHNLKHLIVNDDSNGYVAFGKYHLSPGSYGYTVSTWDRTVHTFGNKRTAISWCVADKYSQFKLANSIQVLDTKKQQLASDIHCRNAQAQRSSTEDFYETVTTKIQTKQLILDSVTTELDKCINSAKYLQLRGFNNETA
jgi:hypothetical protein